MGAPLSTWSFGLRHDIRSGNRPRVPSHHHSMRGRALARAIEMREQGYSYRAIANALGCARMTVHRALDAAESNGQGDWFPERIVCRDGRFYPRRRKSPREKLVKEPRLLVPADDLRELIRQRTLRRLGVELADRHGGKAATWQRWLCRIRHGHTSKTSLRLADSLHVVLGSWRAW